MNWLDIGVIIILLINGFISYQRGFIRTLFNFLSFIVAIIITSQIYTYFSGFIINHTGIYTAIKNSIIQTMNLQPANANVTTPQQQISFINNIGLPDYIQHLLLENNNSEVYQLLDVQHIGDYIGSLLATVTINILSFIVVFILVKLAIRLIVNILDLISKLPVLNQVNKLGGLIIGLGIGVVIIWFVCLGISLLVTNPKYSYVIEAIEQSQYAIFFYENNMLMKLVTNITNTIMNMKPNV